MPAELIKGLPFAQETRASIIERVGRCAQRGIEPCLAVVVASDDPAVAAYAQSKAKLADKLGIRLRLEQLAPERGAEALKTLLRGLSADPAVHGILLELPVADGLDAEGAIACIDPAKDVDGLTTANLGKIASGDEAGALASATPLACIVLAESVRPLAGARVALIGRGRTVGRPLACMLTNRHATVTVCHSRTPDLPAAVAPADFVFTAAGSPGLVDAGVIAEGQIVIDAGISVVDGRVVGDVDADSVGAKARALSPVPGGVGTLTSTLIFDNVLRAMALQGVLEAADG